MNYVKIQKFKNFRHTLIATNAQNITISEIARQYNFWSLGHFSSNYLAIIKPCLANILQKPLN